MAADLMKLKHDIADFKKKYFDLLVISDYKGIYDKVKEDIDEFTLFWILCDNIFNENIFEYMGDKIPEYFVEENCNSNLINDYIEEIVIPKNITNIGEFAFCRMSALKSINMENAPIKELDQFVFYNDPHLENIVLPKTLEKIDIGAFSRCQSVKKLFLPDSLYSIENFVFSGWSEDAKIIARKNVIRDQSDHPKAIKAKGKSAEFLKTNIEFVE